MQKLRGFILICLAAMVGYALVVVPGAFIDYYQRAKDIGQAWAYAYLTAVSLGAVLILAAFSWTAYRLIRNTQHKKKQRQDAQLRAADMGPEQTRRVVDENIAQVGQLADHAELSSDERAAIDRAVAQLSEKAQTQTLEIVAFGTISSGKSSVLNALMGEDKFEARARGGTTVTRHEVAWPGQQGVRLVDTPGIGEVGDRDHQSLARECARNSDLVLLVIDGPLRATEFATLQVLVEMEKRIVICLNKSDWFKAEDLNELISQITVQTKSLVKQEDIVAVRASPTTRPVVMVAPDGSERLEQVPVDANITALADRLLGILKHDGKEVLVANLLLQSRALVAQAKEAVHTRLDEKAEEIVNRYMWRAGAAAAIVPVPVADLAVALAVSTKMVAQLAKVYRQPIELATLKKMIEQMPLTLGPLAGAHLATPMVSATIASSVKSIPGIGTVAGGVLQGLTQVVVTRWIGRVFTVYFRNEMNAPSGSLADLVREKWDEVTGSDQLAALVKEGINRLARGDDDKPRT